MSKSFSKKFIQESCSDEDPEDVDCPSDVEGDDIEVDEQEEVHDGATLQIEQPDTNNIELNSAIEAAVKKIRDTAKMFRKSPVSNDMLQKCIKADPDINKSLKLILDVKTRWVRISQVCLFITIFTFIVLTNI